VSHLSCHPRAGDAAHPPLFRLTVSVLAAVVVLAGCGKSGPKTAVVRGTVTYKGKPVPNGSVLFVPDGGPTATGEIGPDGSYTLTTFKKGDGAVLGPHKVIISATQDMGDRLPEDRSPMPPPIVPEKYSSYGTTDLKVEVKDEENVINFDLKGEIRHRR
jgi:hypothetical protein